VGLDVLRRHCDDAPAEWIDRVATPIATRLADLP